MFNINKGSWFKWAVDKPDTLKPDSYKGRFVRVKDEDGKPIVVEIERMSGSLVYPSRFEITSKGKQYLIVMLDFFGQMNGEHFTEQQIKDFDETQFEVKANTWKKQNGLMVRNKLIEN